MIASAAATGWGSPCHHCRRKIFEVWETTKSPVAKVGLDHIALIYAIENKARFAPPAERLAHRAATIPLLDAFFAWAQTTERKLSSRSALAEALRYMIKRRTALSRFATDARLEADNNIAENAIRCIAMRRPLCPSSSSLWKHWKLVFRRDATRAICSGNRVNHPFVLQVGSPDLIRSPRYDLLGGKDAVADQPSDAVVCDPERRSGLGHRQPFAVLLGGTVGVNAVDPAHRADTVRGPGLALTGRHSHPVQCRGDIRVRPAGRHAPHHRERCIGRAAPVLAGFWLADAQ